MIVPVAVRSVDEPEMVTGIDPWSDAMTTARELTEVFEPREAGSWAEVTAPMVFVPVGSESPRVTTCVAVEESMKTVAVPEATVLPRTRT